uniref:MSP domain-containing protein n=1 Tax=Strongyloides stercoralis TaxID=6248 RepID=A0A0K0DUG5_STRER
MSHFNHTVIVCVVFFTLFSTIFIMFLFRKKKKQKKRKKDEDSNIESIDKNIESKIVSSSYYKSINKDQFEMKSTPITESIDEDNIIIVNNEERSLNINDFLNVTPDPILMDENDTGISYITNYDKELWICYRILASYPLNYVITNSMGFIKPQDTIKILIKFISSSDNTNSVYCFAEEHAIMIQWFFLSESEVNYGPKYFFIRKYRKSNWRSKVIRCIFIDNYRQNEMTKKQFQKTH